MAEVNVNVNAKQILYSLKEIISILIAQQGIHEGHWTIALEFQLGAAIAGPTPENSMPTGMVGVSRIGIQSTIAGNVLSVDAAISNPLQAKSEEPIPGSPPVMEKVSRSKKNNLTP